MRSQQSTGQFRVWVVRIAVATFVLSVPFESRAIPPSGSGNATLAPPSMSSKPSTSSQPSGQANVGRMLVRPTIPQTQRLGSQPAQPSYPTYPSNLGNRSSAPRQLTPIPMPRSTQPSTASRMLTPIPLPVPQPNTVYRPTVPSNPGSTSAAPRQLTPIHLPVPQPNTVYRPTVPGNPGSASAASRQLTPIHLPVPQPSYSMTPPANVLTWPLAQPQSTQPPANVLTSPLAQSKATQPPANKLLVKRTPPKNNLALLLPKTSKLPGGVRAKLDVEKWPDANRQPVAGEIPIPPASGEQLNVLKQMLGGLLGGYVDQFAGDNNPDLKQALQEAKNGNLDPLKKFVDDYKKQHPDLNQSDQLHMVDALDAYIKATELVQQAQAGQPLDQQKLSDLGKDIDALPDPTFKNPLAKAAAQLDALNKLVPLVPPGGAGPGGQGIVGPWIGGAGPGGFWPGQAVYPPGYLPGAIYGPPVPDVAAPVTPGDIGAPVTAADVGAPVTAGAVGSAPVTQGDIVLLNRQENAAVVQYMISNQQYQLGIGRTHSFGMPSQGAWIITFDRGGSYGSARYSLSVGTYEFVLTQSGWDLRQKQYIVTIDNSRLAGNFNCLVNGQQTVVPAGDSVTQTSPYPLEIVFDRGDGSEPARKMLDNGVYTVGIDPTRQRLDLFPASSVNASAPTPSPTAVKN